MARILITDGEQRAALAAVRSLGRAGHEIFVLASRKRSIAATSRYSRAHATICDPLSSAIDYAQSIRGRIDAWHIDVLLPISEASLLAVLAQHDRFADVVIPFPDYSTFRQISDKQAVLDAAGEMGLRVPEQVVLQASGELPSLRYPAVAKPTRSVVGENGTRSKTVATQVATEADLRELLSTMPAAAYPILIQQRIAGPGVGVFVLMWDGELMAHFGHRRIREKPPWGGISVYRESAEVDEHLLQLSVELLRRFNWSGVAMVEYKIDAATHQPYLMEINGRFWGSLQLAIDAEVDFPKLLVDAALGRKPPPTSTYRAGVRSRWWWGDVDHLLARLRHSKEELGLPAHSPGRSRAILDFLLAFGPGNRNEVLRLSDPLPALFESVDWLRRS